MRVLGLAGGIATGKSTVATLLLEQAQQCGWRVAHLDADLAARAVVAPGTDGLLAVLEHFGSAFALPKGHPEAGALDRPKLGALVFADAEARQALEALLHPRIVDTLRSELAAADAEGCQLALLNAAILLEMGLDALCDAVAVVWCLPEVQLERLRARNGLSAEAAAQRMASQWSNERRLARADWQLRSDRPLADMPAAVASLLDQVRARWPELAGAGQSDPR